MKTESKTRQKVEDSINDMVDCIPPAGLLVAGTVVVALGTIRAAAWAMIYVAATVYVYEHYNTVQ
jgi:hypothetical protein